MKIVNQSVELLWATNKPEKQIERAGRTCYKSEDRITDESAGAFVGRMKASGHHAMIEHAVASFLIITERGVSHEIVRHRLASYAQESTRYCNYSKDKFDNELTFIKPPNLTTAHQMSVWSHGCQFAEMGYLELIESGLSPEIARSLLPTCLKTEIVMTANLREWLHFINLRTSKAAHPQIQMIARAIQRELTLYAPNIFG